MLFLAILISSLLLQLFLPWWIIVPLAFILAGWKGKSGGHAFWAGFLSICILWIIMGLIKTIPNENLLANRVGQMFLGSARSFNWIIVLAITGVVGGISGGFAAMSGFYCRKAFIG